MRASARKLGFRCCSPRALRMRSRPSRTRARVFLSAQGREGRRRTEMLLTKGEQVSDDRACAAGLRAMKGVAVVSSPTRGFSGALGRRRVAVQPLGGCAKLVGVVRFKPF